MYFEVCEIMFARFFKSMFFVTLKMSVVVVALIFSAIFWFFLASCKLLSIGD